MMKEIPDRIWEIREICWKWKMSKVSSDKKTSEKIIFKNNSFEESTGDTVSSLMFFFYYFIWLRTLALMLSGSDLTPYISVFRICSISSVRCTWQVEPTASPWAAWPTARGRRRSTSTPSSCCPQPSRTPPPPHRSSLPGRERLGRAFTLAITSGSVARDLQRSGEDSFTELQNNKHLQINVLSDKPQTKDRFLLVFFLSLMIAYYWLSRRHSYDVFCPNFPLSFLHSLHQSYFEIFFSWDWTLTT